MLAVVFVTPATHSIVTCIQIYIYRSACELKHLTLVACIDLLCFFAALFGLILVLCIVIIIVVVVAVPFVVKPHKRRPALR